MKKSGLRRPVFSIVFRLFGAKCVCVWRNIFPVGNKQTSGPVVYPFYKKRNTKNNGNPF
jgi:hypothetical protein